MVREHFVLILLKRLVVPAIQSRKAYNWWLVSIQKSWCYISFRAYKSTKEHKLIWLRANFTIWKV